MVTRGYAANQSFTFRCLCRVVVADHAQFDIRLGGGNLAEEVNELGRGVPLVASTCADLSGEHVQGREERPRCVGIEPVFSVLLGFVRIFCGRA